MNRTRRADPVFAGTIDVRIACAVGVALVVILSCSGCGDSESFQATPEDIVGDWSVDVGRQVEDTCHIGIGPTNPFLWRLTADGDSVTAQDDSSCEPYLLGVLADDRIVTYEFDDTVELADCTVIVHRTEVLEFTSRNRATFTYTDERTASGSGCAGLGIPDHCTTVWQRIAERCDLCYECANP